MGKRDPVRVVHRRGDGADVNVWDRTGGGRDSPTDDPPPKEEPKPEVTIGSGKDRAAACDEVGCLIDPDRDCCARYRKPRGGGASDDTSGAAGSGAILTMADLRQGIDAIKGLS